MYAHLRHQESSCPSGSCAITFTLPHSVLPAPTDLDLDGKASADAPRHRPATVSFPLGPPPPPSTSPAPPPRKRRVKLTPISAATATPSAGATGKMAYAVRSEGQGVVFDSYGSARDLYHQLQAAGGSPALASGPSLTDGICFLEGVSPLGTSEASLQRRKWIEEEYAARRQNITASWRESPETEYISSDSESDISLCVTEE